MFGTDQSEIGQRARSPSGHRLDVVDLEGLRRPAFPPRFTNVRTTALVSDKDLVSHGRRNVT